MECNLPGTVFDDVSKELYNIIRETLNDANLKMHADTIKHHICDFSERAVDTGADANGKG